MDYVAEAPSQYHLNPAFQQDDKGTHEMCAPDEKYAITVRHAKIQYTDVMGALISGTVPKTNVVLKDFNMSVKKGHIYGLLGASGCGKTSILRALVGQIELTAGEIRVLGHKPKTPQSRIPGTTIGYMPQDPCLIEEFTIKESLSFYGQLAGMSFKEIHDKSNNLVKLLDLPEPNTMVETLSGGQKRRVSFAIALIHSPPVLVLDEPTVGVDPLLRESIWEFLTNLAKTNKNTILITTHYIEESSQADTVGLMRHGKLMAEQNPMTLMDSLNCNNLEDVLVKLCVLQSPKEQSTSSVNAATIELPGLQKVDEDIVSSEKSAFEMKNVSSVKRVQVLTWKNAISYVRHPAFLVYILMYPTMSILLLGFTYGRTPSHMKISVFNAEANCFSNGLIAPYRFEKNTNCEMPSFLSCKILEALKETQVTPVSFEFQNAAENSVRMGQTWGTMTFSSNFTSALLKRAGLSPRKVEEDVLDMGSIKVRMDQSDQTVSNLVQINILRSFKKVLGDMNAVCHNFRHMKELPIQYKTPIYGSETSFIDSVAPGILTSFGLMNPLTAAVATLLPEKISGTMERGLVAGVRMGEVVLSHFIICFIPSCASLTVLVLITYVFFGLTMNGSYWTLAVILLPLEVSGLLLGYDLAVLCDTTTMAYLLGTGIYFACFFTSGALWPLEGIYPYIRPICWVFPITLPTEAIRYIAVRGWSLFNRTVLLALTSLLLWSFTFLALLLFILRFKR